MNLSLKKVLKNNDVVNLAYDKTKEFYYKHLISDEKTIRKRFEERLGREVELDDPIKFNDKLQWLKLNWYDPIATKCADKYEVRQIVNEKIGSEYSNELYGVYESVDEIDINALPDKFVLKGTHGSGYNIICKNKNEIDWDNAFKSMKRWLRTNYYWGNREWVYKDMKPRIICEKYLSGEDGNPPNDYKIFCFNGEPKIINVDSNRFTSHTKNFYDLEWNYVDLSINNKSNNPDKLDEKPVCFEEMIRLAEIMSEGFPHVRVDFYIIKNKIIFGELTFWHASGMGIFKPEKFETTMGNWLELPNIVK